MRKTKYFIANWKANKNLDEALSWFDDFLINYRPEKEKIIIICPPFPLIFPLKQKIKKYNNIYLGTQDISAFEEGAYTGEVTAKNLFGLINFALVGHSERRRYFLENNDSVNKKIILAKKYQIEPILCISNQKELEPASKTRCNFVAYEPVGAIGTGKNEQLTQVIKFKKALNLDKKTRFFYGGSINEKNSFLYWKDNAIDGVLVGSASLDPKKFLAIIYC